MDNFELTECTYECIKDTFYYGLFGDFKLVIDKATGYFNATKLCIDGGKNYRNWSRLEKSKNMVEYYQKSCRSYMSGSFLYEVKLQNNDLLNKKITGTYVPKELILDIASWISIEFYDKCNKVVINHFIKEFKKMDKTKFKNKIKEVERQMEEMTLKHDEEIKVKDDKIDQLLDSNKRLEKYVRSLGISLEEVKDQNEELLDNNKGLDKEVKKVQRKLGIAVEDRAPLPDDKKKQERFVLIKRNDPDYLPYYTIRAQNDYTSRRLRSQKALFPDMEVLLDFRSNPNSKTLYVRIKDNLKARGVTFEGNNIDLNEAVTEDELIDEMKVINDQKYDV
jgi:SMC interacting uncharacterized protein involved in chromosome segregation